MVVYLDVYPALVLKTPLVPEMGPTSDTSPPPDMMWAKLP
jgi:hypothetical protein